MNDALIATVLILLIAFLLGITDKPIERSVRLKPPTKLPNVSAPPSPPGPRYRKGNKRA